MLMGVAVYYAAAWLERRAQHSVSERVLENYAGVIRRDLAPVFGPLPLDEIRRRHVNDLVGELAASGKAHNTIRNVLVPLRKVLNDAVDDELLAANPALRITIPANAPTRAAVIPTTEQLDHIMAAAGEDARDVIGVVAALGLRRGEVFALRWRDVDFSEGLVTVAATNHRGHIYDRTKTAAGTRLVPLFDSARKRLLARRLRLRPGLTEPEAFVFANQAGGALDPGNWYRRAWLPAVVAAVAERFHFHDLRHFAATRLDEQGMGGKLRTEIIGRADERITNAVYTHIGRARLSAAANSFDPLSNAVVDQR
jgi:integrase